MARTKTTPAKRQTAAQKAKAQQRKALTERYAQKMLEHTQMGLQFEELKQRVIQSRGGLTELESQLEELGGADEKVLEGMGLSVEAVEKGE
jgi:hypothetical protein